MHGLNCNILQEHAQKFLSDQWQKGSRVTNGHTNGQENWSAKPGRLRSIVSAAVSSVGSKVQMSLHDCGLFNIMDVSLYGSRITLQNCSYTLTATSR